MVHPWETVYKQNKFKITTLKPSIVIESNKHLFSQGNTVFDIGCGNGRNSIFLANKGCIVDAIDVADLKWLEQIPEKVRKNIHFQKQDVTHFKWVYSFYDAVILTRIIQYIDIKSLDDLIRNIFESLTKKGILLISYNKSGGIHTKEEINVPKFVHDLKIIETLLSKFFKEVQISKGSSTSVHVGYTGPIESYDIICFK